MAFRTVMAVSALALALPGCVSAIKQHEVGTALRDVGFTEADARCLAARAGRQMTVRQLRSLQQAANSMDKPIREMPVGDVIDAVRNHVDPDTLRLMGRLAMECAQARANEAAQ